MGIYHLGKDKAKDLTGLFIYQDKKKGAVYFDVFSKSAYILKDKDIGFYRIIRMAIPTAPVVSLVAYNYLNLPVWVSVFIGVAFLIICYACFLNLWLYKLPEIPNYKKPIRDSLLTETAKKISRGSLIFLIVILGLLAVSCIAYSIMLKNNAINYKASYSIALISFAVIAIITILIVVKILSIQSKLEDNEEEA